MLYFVDWYPDSKLSNIFGETVFKLFGKCIDLIQYRQIRETESAEKLAVDEHACLKED